MIINCIKKLLVLDDANYKIRQVKSKESKWNL